MFSITPPDCYVRTLSSFSTDRRPRTNGPVPSSPPPPIKRVFRRVVYVAAAAFAPPLHYLSTYNRAQMQDVFLGKGTWAVLCSGGDNGDSEAVTKRFGTAARAMKGSVKFGVVDCTGSLPSGKSILQKFDLSVSFVF